MQAMSHNNGALQKIESLIRKQYSKDGFITVKDIQLDLGATPNGALHNMIANVVDTLGYPRRKAERRFKKNIAEQKADTPNYDKIKTEVIKLLKSKQNKHIERDACLAAGLNLNGYNYSLARKALAEMQDTPKSKVLKEGIEMIKQSYERIAKFRTEYNKCADQFAQAQKSMNYWEERLRTEEKTIEEQERALYSQLVP